MKGVSCGVDLVKVPRIQEVIEKHGEAFLRRIFTGEEVAYCESHVKRRFEHYAGRFAAKEAFYKAVSPQGAKIRFKDVEVKHLHNGAPEIHITPEERKRLGLSEDVVVAVTLSHDTDYAIAVVVIS